MIKFIYIYYRKNIAIQKLTTANQPYLCVALVAIQIKLSKLFPDYALLRFKKNRLSKITF